MINFFAPGPLAASTCDWHCRCPAYLAQKAIHLTLIMRMTVLVMEGVSWQHAEVQQLQHPYRELRPCSGQQVSLRHGSSGHRPDWCQHMTVTVNHSLH